MELSEFGFGLFVTCFVIISLLVGFKVNDHKRNLCEHEGLGKWHTWSQVCEPTRDSNNN